MSNLVYGTIAEQQILTKTNICLAKLHQACPHDIYLHQGSMVTDGDFF